MCKNRRKVKRKGGNGKGIGRRNDLNQQTDKYYEKGKQEYGRKKEKDGMINGIIEITAIQTNELLA